MLINILTPKPEMSKMKWKRPYKPLHFNRTAMLKGGKSQAIMNFGNELF